VKTEKKASTARFYCAAIAQVLRSLELVLLWVGRHLG
jgi:hypothetical protein